MQSFQIQSLDGRDRKGVVVRTLVGPVALFTAHLWWFDAEPKGVARPVPDQKGKPVVFGDGSTAVVSSFAEQDGVVVCGLSRAPDGVPALGDAVGAAVALTQRGDVGTILSRDGAYRFASSTRFQGGDSGSPVRVGEAVVGIVNNPTSVTRLAGIRALASHVQTTPPPDSTGASPVTREQLTAMRMRYAGKRVSTGRGNETLEWDRLLDLMEKGL